MKNRFLRKAEAESKITFDNIGDVGKLHPDILSQYPIYRIWLKKGTPLNELNYEWTYEDIIKANAVLDMEQCYETVQDMYHIDKVEKVK